MKMARERRTRRQVLSVAEKSTLLHRTRADDDLTAPHPGMRRRLESQAAVEDIALGYASRPASGSPLARHLHACKRVVAMSCSSIPQ